MTEMTRPTFTAEENRATLNKMLVYESAMATRYPTRATYRSNAAALGEAVAAFDERETARSCYEDACTERDMENAERLRLSAENAQQARTLAAIREWAESDTPIPAGETTQLVAGVDAAKFVVRQILDPPATEE